MMCINTYSLIERVCFEYPSYILSVEGTRFPQSCYSRKPCLLYIHQKFNYNRIKTFFVYYPDLLDSEDTTPLLRPLFEGHDGGFSLFPLSGNVLRTLTDCQYFGQSNDRLGV